MVSAWPVLSAWPTNFETHKTVNGNPIGSPATQESCWFQTTGFPTLPCLITVFELFVDKRNQALPRQAATPKCLRSKTRWLRMVVGSRLRSQYPESQKNRACPARFNAAIQLAHLVRQLSHVLRAGTGSGPDTSWAINANSIKSCSSKPSQGANIIRLTVQVASDVIFHAFVRAQRSITLALTGSSTMTRMVNHAQGRRSGLSNSRSSRHLRNF